ncbi:MAG: hypothetical protein HYU68_13110 [Bacteroidetes bacterium]|nr:hypothetical protein [Bacteroidota bacterium]
MYKGLVIFLLAFQLQVNGQEQISFQKIDSLSFYQFTNAKWNNLIETKQLAEKNNIDYFYLNLRVGIAYYHKKMFYRAEKYLSKANRQNSLDETTLSYLYYAALENSNYFQMSKIHQDVFGDSTKITKAIGSINFDAGIKISSNSDKAGHLSNFSVGLSHLPLKNLILYQSFTSIHQPNNIWGDGKQLQYYLGSSIKLNSNWKLDVASHFYQYSATIDYHYASSSVKTTPPSFSGDYRIDSTFNQHHLLTGNYSQTGAIIHLGITKYAKIFKFSPFVQLNLEKSTSDITELTWKEVKEEKFRPNSMTIKTIENKDSIKKDVYVPSSNKIVLGTSIVYSLPYFNEKFSIGLNIYQPIGKGKVKGTISPFLTMRMGKSSLFMSYFYKNNFALAEFNATVLINTYDVIHNRINAQWSLPINRKNTIGLLYQWEDKTDSFSYSRYQSNMFLVSYYLKF